MGSDQDWSPPSRANRHVRAGPRAPSRRRTQGVGGRECARIIRPRAGSTGLAGRRPVRIAVLEQASIVIEQACSAGRHRIGLGLSSWLA